jgi:metallo-beta-lactamase class B
MSRAWIAAAAILAAGPAAAQEPWKIQRPPFRVIDNVYYVGAEGLGAYLITTPAGHILLDVGMPGDAEVVEKRIKRLGFKLTDIKILLNSHAHNDHAGGLAKLKKDTRAALVSSEGDRRWLESGAGSFPGVKVDRTVGDGESVELGGVVMTARLTPGHTPGCTTWTWPVKDEAGAVHTAIDFCSASIGPNNLNPEQYPGMIADYRATFAKAKTIQGDVFLAPHVEFFDLDAKLPKRGQGGTNPFIDRAGYLALINRQQAAFEGALAERGIR